MTKVLYWLTFGSDGPTVDMMKCDAKRRVEQDEFQIPIECMHLFDDEMLPVGVDRDSLDVLIKHLIVIGYCEASARASIKDSYPTLEQLLISEQEARTLQCMLAVREGLECDGVAITPEKMMRSFERLRKCGRIAHDHHAAKAA